MAIRHVMDPKQLLALDMSSGRYALENDMGVRLDTIRKLAALGYVTLNEFKGRYGDSKKVTHWNARATEKGHAYLAAHQEAVTAAYEEA